MKKKWRWYIGFGMFSFLFPYLMLAQTSFLPDQVRLSVIPLSPRPGQNVTVRAESSAIDIDRARLSWSVNGKSAGSGIGLKSISFAAAPAGTRTSVHLDIAAADGRVFVSDTALQSGIVDLLWSADSYTPPLYRGKGLPAANSSVTIVAIVANGEGGAVTPGGNFTYTWKKNGTVQGPLSGRGRDRITVSGPNIGDTMHMEVEVVGGDGTQVGIGRAVIAAAPPEVLIYRRDPLLGVFFNTAIFGVVSLTEQETVFSAYPYFFSASDRQIPLDYRWSIDGKNAESVIDDHASIAVRVVGDASGQSSVGVAVEHAKKLLQTAGFSFLVSFNAPK